MSYKITLIKETACLMLTKGEEYVDSVFLNLHDLEGGHIEAEQVQEEVDNLAILNGVKEYTFTI